jgi:4-hydroxybenzoate polyprenyltransferase
MKWLHFVLSHSIFIAVCAVALAFQTGLLLKFNIDLFVYGFIFFATVCSYNFYWVISKAYFAGDKAFGILLKKEKTGLVILILSAIGVFFCLFQYPLPVAFIITSFLLTCLYILPLLPFRPFYFTRKAGVLKTFLLAFTWTYVTVFIPLQKTYLLLSGAELFVFTRSFLFMLMLCIIFDNRDKAVDKLRGLHSLATVLKPAHLRIVIYLIFVVLFTTNFLYRYYEITYRQSVALHISTLALLAVYFYSRKKRGYLFYYFFVDGMMLFSALATYITGI